MTVTDFLTQESFTFPVCLLSNVESLCHSQHKADFSKKSSTSKSLQMWIEKLFYIEQHASSM